MNRVERLVVYERVREEFLIESLLIAFTERIEELIAGHEAHCERLQQQLNDEMQQQFHAHAQSELTRLLEQKDAMTAQRVIWESVCNDYFDDVARVEMRFKQLAMLQPDNEAYYKEALEHVKKISSGQ